MMSTTQSWIVRLTIVFLAAAGFPGCGGGGGGGGDAAPTAAPVPVNPNAPGAVVNTPVGTQSAGTPIAYQLSQLNGDSLSILVEYSTDGGVTFQKATPSPASDPITGLASSPTGVAHNFVWNSQMDGVGQSVPNPNVQIRITPVDGGVAGSPVASASFNVDNSANTPPSITLPTMNYNMGIVRVNYTLIDAGSDPCSIKVEFSTDSGATFATATDGPGYDGRFNLSSSPGGTSHVYVWNSFADGITGSVGTIQLRFTPNDGKAGAPVASNTFRVDNGSQYDGGEIAYWPQISDPTTNLDAAKAVSTDGSFLWIAGIQNEIGTSSNPAWRIEKRGCFDGGLISAFGTNGVIVSNPGPGHNEVKAMAIDSKWMYVAGKQETASGSKTYMWRVEKRSLLDGSFDPSFGTAGVALSAALGDLPCLDMKIDSSFLYLVMGQGLSSTHYQLRFEKLNLSNGTSVAGFGTSGVVQEDVDPNGNAAMKVAIDSTYMYVAGIQDYGVDPQIRFEKRNLSDGSLVATFGTGGALTVNQSVGGAERPIGIAIDSSYIYALELVETPAGSGTLNWLLEKRNLSDGALVSSASPAASSPNGYDPQGSLIVDGPNLYLAGSQGPSGSLVWRIEKRNAATLNLVTAFGGGGSEVFCTPGPDCRPSAQVVAGGILYTVGMDSQGATSGSYSGGVWTPGGDPGEWHLDARYK